jgi:hypothetical protein
MRIVALSTRLWPAKAQFWFIIALAFIIIVALRMGNTTTVEAAADIGYRDMAYKESGIVAPTAEKPQSKLWYADNSWWGTLYNRDANEHRIHQLDWATQTWSDTGVAIDDRKNSLADTLWDGQYLYVASGTSSGPGKLYRYTYADNTYSPSPGFPVTITNDGMEAIVLAKDGQGTLWITYTKSQKVYIAHSTTDDLTWDSPYVLPVSQASNLTNDDISSIIAYQGRIGVMWSNQSLEEMYFAVHVDGAPDDVWQSVAAYVPSADDHVNLKSLQVDTTGNVFAAVKTSLSSPGQPEIVLLACTSGDCTSAGNWEAHTVFTQEDGNHKTRPIVLIDTTNRDLYVFMATTGGGSIYYKKSSIDAIAFPPGDGTTFIEFSGASIDNPSSTKQNLTSDTHLVVLASDATYYYHNCLTLTGSAECPDPNAATVQFSAAEYSVAENGVKATITVTRSGATSGTAQVSYATSDGTATAGNDYTANSGTLTFGPGETEETFDVLITNDSLDEVDESVTLTLSEPTNGASLGSPAVATLHITDNDAPPTVQFSSDSYSVNEATSLATITVLLSSASGQTVHVDYSSSDGTASAGNDYAAVSDTLEFAPGETSATFTVPILQDALDESGETLNLSLSNFDNLEPGIPLAAVLTIVDNDDPPLVQLNAATFAANENGNSVTVVVNLSAPSGQSVTVDYATSDGTATAAEDYAAVAGTLTFAPGQTSQSFMVAILNDELDEPNETAEVTLSAPVNGALGVPASATLTITDDDPMPSIHFTQSAYEVSEGNTTAAVSVTLSAASSFTVTVHYATSDGTATNGSDYIATNGVLSFDPGETSQSFSVTILPYGLNESDETINLALSNAGHAVLGTPQSSTLTILEGGFVFYLPALHFSP